MAKSHNEKMKDIKFPMTNPTDLLAKVAGKKYVTTMDLKQLKQQISQLGFVNVNVQHN